MRANSVRPFPVQQERIVAFAAACHMSLDLSPFSRLDWQTGATYLIITWHVSTPAYREGTLTYSTGTI